MQQETMRPCAKREGEGSLLDLGELNDINNDRYQGLVMLGEGSEGQGELKDGFYVFHLRDWADKWQCCVLK